MADQIFKGDKAISGPLFRKIAMTGRVVLQMPDFTIEIAYTWVDELLYEAGDPFGVVLSGRGTLFREGQTKAFAATVRDGTTTSVPECLIWDIPGPPVIEGLNFDAEGRLTFREQ